MTTPGNKQLQPNVASGVRPVAETMRQLIEYGLQMIRDDIASPNSLFMVDELFSMWGPDVIAQVKEYLTEHTTIPVIVGWPLSGLSLPQICVVTQAEKELSESDFIGDIASTIGQGSYVLEDGQNTEVSDNNTVQRVQKSMSVKGSTGLFVRAKDPLLTTYLTHAVRLIVFSNKRDLIKDGDIHNLMIDVEEVAHNPELFPEQAYTRVVSLNYDTFFDYNLPEKVIKRLSFSLLVNTAKFNPSDGSVHDELAVPVPPVFT